MSSELADVPVTIVDMLDVLRARACGAQLIEVWGCDRVVVMRGAGLEYLVHAQIVVAHELDFSGT
jgi:hypothetical protein